MLEKKIIKATGKYIRISPAKACRVLTQIRGRSYKEALMILEFLPYKSCDPIWKVLNSAAANAQNNLNLKKQNLFIKTVFANKGPTLRRMKARAQGRGYKILKPTCHITIILELESNATYT